MNRAAALPLLLLLPGLAFAGARVSAMKVDSKKGKTFYSGSAAIDGKLDTVWMVPGESENTGEWIEIEVPKGTIDKIAIYPGHGRDEDAYGDYARVKTMRVDVYDIADDQTENQIGQATIEVADKAALQFVDIDDVKVGSGLFGGKVKLTVTAVYDGEDYPNLAVAEIMVALKEFDAPKPPELSDVSSEVDGHTADLMQDGDPKTFWAADDGASFVMTSDAFGLSSIAFVPQKDYARPKTVELSVGSVSRTVTLPDAPGPQWAMIPPFNGYNGGGFGPVTVKIVDSYPGKIPHIGVTELAVRVSHATSI